MEASAKLTEIIEQLKVANQNENEPKVSKISRLEIIFMEILQVLKTNIEDAKQRAKIERTFQEEKDYESEQRHKEFLEVLKQFVSLKSDELQEKQETKEEKTGGILDFFKNMIRGLVKTIKALFIGTLKLLGKLLKFTVFLSKRLFSLLKNVYKFLRGVKWLSLIKSIKNIILNPKVISFLSGLARGLAPAALLGLGIYAGREALQELVNRMPDYSKINYKEAYNVLENGTQQQIRHFSEKLDVTGVFESGDEIRAFRNASPEGKIQLFVMKGKELRREQLREKKKNEQFISQEDLKNLKKINPEMYLNDDEREELNELENEPFLPKVSTQRINEIGTPNLKQEIEKNNYRVGLENNPFDLLESAYEKPVLPYFESSTRVAIETKNLNELMDEKNELIVQLKKERNARKRHEIQTKITELDRKIFEVKHNIQRQDKTKPVEAVTRSLVAVEQPVSRPYESVNEETTSETTRSFSPAVTQDSTITQDRTITQDSTVTPTRSFAPVQNETATPAATATPMPTIYEGEQPPTTGPNSFEEMDKKPLPVETMSSSLPLPSEATSYRAPTKIERNPYEIDNTQESLRRFINYNESMRLKNDLLRMSEEYEELGRILKGVSQQPVKPVDSSSPISRMFNERNIENINLQLQNMFSVSEDIKPIVNNNGRTEVIPDVPLSVEASQRDDTHTLSIVLNRYKRSYV